MGSVLLFIAGLAVGVFIGASIASRFARDRGRRPSRDLLQPPRFVESSHAQRRLSRGEIDEDIRRLAADGHKIEAIRKLRERSGMGLKEAKDAIERLD